MNATTSAAVGGSSALTPCEPNVHKASLDVERKDHARQAARHARNWSATGSGEHACELEGSNALSATVSGEEQRAPLTYMQ